MDVIPQNWYKTWFGNEYLTVYAHRDENEALDLIRLIRKNIPLSSKAYILDLCCGQGRHSIHLAELGYHVIGMDLSRTLLQAAKYRSEGTDTAKFIQADMRALPFHRGFDLLLNLFTSFGYFETDRENLNVFTEFRKVLKRNAWFVFDYINTEHVISNLNPFQEEKVGDMRITQHRTIDNDRVMKKITLKRNDQKSVFYEAVKMYEPDKIFNMLNSAGLRFKKVFGDYNGAEFNTQSPRFIIFGQSMS